MLEEAWMKEEIAKSETAQAAIERIANEAHRIDSKIDGVSRSIGVIESRYNRVQSLLGEFEASIKSRIITDESITNGVNAFTLILESVRDVFGEENMTEAVICKAIEAGSYGYWRSIMGPKNPESNQDKRNSR